MVVVLETAPCTQVRQNTVIQGGIAEEDLGRSVAVRIAAVLGAGHVVADRSVKPILAADGQSRRKLAPALRRGHISNRAVKRMQDLGPADDLIPSEHGPIRAVVDAVSA